MGNIRRRIVGVMFPTSVCVVQCVLLLPFINILQQQHTREPTRFIFIHVRMSVCNFVHSRDLGAQLWAIFDDEL